MSGVGFLVQAVVNNAHIYIDPLAVVLLAMGMCYAYQKNV